MILADFMRACLKTGKNSRGATFANVYFIFMSIEKVPEGWTNSAGLEMLPGV